MRLHLIKLLDLQSSPTVLPSALAHHVDPNSSPTKLTLLYVTALRVRSSQFRWRCRELHSSPQRLHLEGITTITYIYNTNVDSCQIF